VNHKSIIQQNWKENSADWLELNYLELIIHETFLKKIKNKIMWDESCVPTPSNDSSFNLFI
jgi:hypothetical protein